MITPLPTREHWLEHALQGLAFWIGHRQSLFRGYPLSEGALVAEACNLIQANLPTSLVLKPEYMYRRLASSDEKNQFGNERADLVICSPEAKGLERDKNLSNFVRFVIEMKRGSSSRESIDADLRRLDYFRTQAAVGVRCFLFVVSEGMAPGRFVKDGQSRKGQQEIQGSTTSCFRVRRSVKAAASFSGKESAHYVVFIEVLPKG
jgi:hypothetical protein